MVPVASFAEFLFWMGVRMPLFNYSITGTLFMPSLPLPKKHIQLGLGHAHGVTGEAFLPRANPDMQTFARMIKFTH
jgi:hypothetical protein